MKLGDPLECAQYELRNPVFHLLASAPGSATQGQHWINTGNGYPFYWTGTAARPLDAAALTDGSIQIAALAVNPLVRANQTGTQPASTISDLATTVKGYTLDSFAAPVTTVNFGSQRASNIAQATNSTDAARWDQVQAYVQSAVQGQTAIKNPVRMYAAGNVSISSPGSLTDGTYTAQIGDRILLANQTTATQNNIYVYNGSSSAMTVASDSSTGSQWLEGTEVLVTDGTTYGGAIFRQTTSGTITLGTNALAFTQTFKINTYTGDGSTTTVAGYQISVKYDSATMTTTSGSLGVRTDVFARKFSGTITGDGATTAFNVSHGLATTDVIVGVRDSTNSKVFVDDNPANSSTVTITFGTAPANGTTYRVTVIG